MSKSKISVIMPVFNGLSPLKACLDSVLRAADHYGEAEVIVVDNGSTDGTYEWMQQEHGPTLRILRLPEVTISAVRNHGARQARGEYLSFIDSDCLVPENYFDRAMEVFRAVPADAAGCECELPPEAGWMEETWVRLHWIQDGYVSYLYGANFLIRRSAFEKVGGFDEGLLTGEDAELAQRLLAAGFKVYRAQAISAVHLRNPKTLYAFFQKQIWHGLGMFGTVRGNLLDKPFVMTLAHLALSLAGGVILALGPGPWALRGLLFMALSFVAPAVTVVYRGVRAHRFPRPLGAVLLYYLYFTARVYALGLILLGRSRAYMLADRKARRQAVTAGSE
ncbi:MAG: glycosyltransferase [Terriglobales bacterium]